MEIGTEISQKIRSAIKAKLIELGAYVDDELPDYIMVMVANKKTQAQMTEDLNLFLGNNTETFTSWLHSLLKKLQSINTDQPASSSKQKHKEKHKGEKRKHKSNHTEKASKVAEPPQQANIVSAEGGGEDVKKKARIDQDRKKDEQVSSSAVPVTGSADSDVGAEISISENTDEFNEENRQNEKLEKTRTSSTGKPPPSQPKRTEKPVEVKKSASKSAGKPKTSPAGMKRDESTRKKPSSFVAAVKRKYEEEEEEEYDPMNPAVGNVASIVRGPSRKSSVPKKLQANKSLLMKAVSDAEKSVSSSKKTDLPATESSLPAMRSDRKPVDLSNRLKTAAGLQLISRSRRKEMMQGMKYTVDNESTRESARSQESTTRKQWRSSDELETMKYTVKNEGVAKSLVKKVSSAAPARVAAAALREISKKDYAETQSQETSDDEEDVEQYGPPLPDTRLVHRSQPSVEENDSQSTTPDTGSAENDGMPVSREDSPGSEEAASEGVIDPEIQKILEDSELDLTDEQYFYEEENKRVVNKGRETPEDPKFIVTLDGVNPRMYPVPPDVKQNIVQTVKPMPSEPPVVPAEPAPPVPRVPSPTVGDQMYSKITPPKIKPFNISLKDTDDEEESEDQPMQSEDQKSPVFNERCRFWPACANGNACQYIHPSIACKTFPYCKFGDKCMYIHPNCKFDANCTRKDCPFTHATKRGSFTQTVIHKIVQVPVPTYSPTTPVAVAARPSSGPKCKFFPNCRNMNCPFTHPKPCRYGIGCMNKNTCAFFHPPLPNKDKLTWKSTDKESSGKSSESLKLLTNV